MDKLYELKVTPFAHEQLNQIINYFNNVLHSSSAANNLIDSIESELQSLTVFPYRFPLADKSLFPHDDIL